MNRLLTSIFLLLLSLNLIAQTASNDICQEGDCPESIFEIQLNEPSAPQNYTPERTEKFKQAYLAFKSIKANLQSNLDWKEKYDAFQLGGAGCLRYYQLESTFGNEYLKNPDFKAIVEKEDPAGANQMVNNGFRSSRRAANLSTRMDSNCPDKKKNAEKKGGTPMSETNNEYQQLGYSLGFFDKDGNVLKALEQPKEYKPRNRMSKNERVEHLNNKVAALPVGAKEKEQLNNIDKDLQKAAPKFEGLKNFATAIAPLVSAFVPNPLSLLSNVGKVANLLGNLTGIKLKFPPNSLLSMVNDLFDKGKKFTDKVQDLVNRSQGLQDKTGLFKSKTDKLGINFKDRVAAVEDLKNKMKDLEQKKQGVLDKLGDKPKKILEDLENEMAKLEGEAQAFKDKLDVEENKKNQLLRQLGDLLKEKDQLGKTLEKLKDENSDLTKAVDDLQKAANQANDEMKAAQQQESELDKVLEELKKLPGEKDLTDNLKICEEDLKKFLARYTPVEKTQSKLKEKMDKVKELPEKLLDKVKNLKIFQNDLRKDKNGNPIAQKSLEKLDKLSDKANKVGSVLELLAGKRTRLQDKLAKIDGKIDQAKDIYDNRANLTDKLQKDALSLLLDKAGLDKQLADAKGTAEDMNRQANALLQKFQLFEDESNCIDLDDLKKKLEEIKGEQAEVKPEIEELDKGLEDARKQQEQVQQETDAFEELSTEQEKLKEQLGEDVNLDPVEPEEWAENFEVKRDYWEAVFHPDDEVVEGYKGRYFQVRLKDAEKKVKLLFGPGEYFMSRGDFRDTYGSVIGAFVTEALNGMRKADQDGIKLFVQGSADITGQNTFKGNLDDNFMYEEITVLPMKGNSDRFESTAKPLQISQKGFTNDDLPNLRGNYLREMISIYSRKLQPILLEGSVTKNVAVEDRNAVIYLFIPEYLVERFSGE